MTKNLYEHIKKGASRDQVPVIVQPLDDGVLIELRAYDENGENRGAIWHKLDRKDTLDLWRALCKWENELNREFD